MFKITIDTKRLKKDIDTAFAIATGGQIIGWLATMWLWMWSEDRTEWIDMLTALVIMGALYFIWPLARFIYFDLVIGSGLYAFMKEWLGFGLEPEYEIVS